MRRATPHPRRRPGPLHHRLVRRRPHRARRRRPGTSRVAEAGSANSSATGVARYVFGSTTAHLSFIATTNGSSVATGRALYYSSSAGVVMAVNVTCLYVSSGTARFLGTVVESSDASLEGDDAYWEVRDAGTDQASLINLAESGTGPDCSSSSEFDLVDIARGPSPSADAAGTWARGSPRARPGEGPRPGTLRPAYTTSTWSSSARSLSCIPSRMPSSAVAMLRRADPFSTSSATSTQSASRMVSVVSAKWCRATTCQLVVEDRRSRRALTRVRRVLQRGGIPVHQQVLADDHLLLRAVGVLDDAHVLAQRVLVIRGDPGRTPRSSRSCRRRRRPPAPPR